MEKKLSKTSMAGRSDSVNTDLETSMLATIEELKETQKLSAVHTYTSTLNSYMAFCTEYHFSVQIEEVFTPGRMKEYEGWLRKKGLTWNSVSTYIRTLKAMYNRLFPAGTPEHNPKLFEDVYTSVESQTKRALTEKQMKKLVNTNISTLPAHLQREMAYFLLMFFFRGMPFIDLVYLRKKDVKGDTIVYCRHKTGKQLTVHIPAEAWPLIEEYKDRNSRSPYFFPILDPNEGKALGLYENYQKALRKFNKKLGKLCLLLLPSARISSYTARHTWATLSYYLGIPIGIICGALGHSSIRVTENYLKPFENEKVDKANHHLITSVTKGKAEKRRPGNRLIPRSLCDELLTK